nr:N,N-dimethylformamidase beta subunit family domain-containing protein [Streptomyces samsunensis]
MDGEHGPIAGGMGRRGFLGAAAAAGAGAAGVAATGCDSSAERNGPRAHPSRRADAARRAEEAERARPGSADWRIRSAGPPDAIEGYTDRVSVLPDGEFGLHVSTTAPAFRVSAYRIGWYGGAQARLVWRSGRVDGRKQSAPLFLDTTRTVRADWDRSLRVRARNWPEGAYLLRLDASNGHQRYVPLIVRSRQARGRTLLMHAPATWQAYNTWGGYSLYQGRDGAYGTRSLAVSFDRPYASSGAEKLLVYERAVVVLAERLGLPLAYTTGVDVHLQPAVLKGASATLSLGHDEYWTPQQRQYVTRPRDDGTNPAILGANTCFRRWASRPTPRTSSWTAATGCSPGPGWTTATPSTIWWVWSTTGSLRAIPPRRRCGSSPTPPGLPGAAQPLGLRVLHGGERRRGLRLGDDALGGGPDGGDP